MEKHYDTRSQRASQSAVVARPLLTSAVFPVLHIALHCLLHQQKQNARLDALQNLKRRLVAMGNNDGREAFELARRLFQDIPALKEI